MGALRNYELSETDPNRAQSEPHRPKTETKLRQN